MGNAEDLNTEECAWALVWGHPLEIMGLPGLLGSFVKQKPLYSFCLAHRMAVQIKCKAIYEGAL